MPSAPLALATLAPALLALPSTSPEAVPEAAQEAAPLRLAVDAGTAVVRTLAWSSELVTQSFEISIGGRPVDVPMDGRTTRTELALAVTDRYGAVEDGRALELVRRFDEALRVRSAEGGGEDVLGDRLGELESDLVGHAVRFAWDAEEGRYAREWAEEDAGGGDDAWLAGLAVDLDLLAFLPGRDVEVGEAWDVPAEAVGALLAPGGVLFFDRPEAAEAPEGGISIAVPNVGVGEHVGDVAGAEGEVRARLAGVVEEEGRRVAVVELELEVELEQDLAQAVGEERGEAFERLVRTLALEGAGTLRFDVAAGRTVAFEFEGRASSAVDAAWTTDALGTELAIECAVAGEGPLALELAAE